MWTPTSFKTFFLISRCMFHLNLPIFVYMLPNQKVTNQVRVFVINGSNNIQIANFNQQWFTHIDSTILKSWLTLALSSLNTSPASWVKTITNHWPIGVRRTQSLDPSQFVHDKLFSQGYHDIPSCSKLIQYSLKVGYICLYNHLSIIENLSVAVLSYFLCKHTKNRHPIKI